jgi:hypothetical protein
MARRAFYSFHYKPDNWRASQVREMRVMEGNRVASPNDWETVTRGGDAAIKRWIDEQMNGKSVVIVLIGAETAARKWIRYEIESGWNAGKALLGIHIHQLKDCLGAQGYRGNNPFSGFNVKGESLDRIVPTINSPYIDSKMTYAYIREHMAAGIEEAIRVRSFYA